MTVEQERDFYRARVVEALKVAQRWKFNIDYPVKRSRRAMVVAFTDELLEALGAKKETV